MADIVERLRFAADDTDAVENASVAYLLEDAAAEIERLRLTDAEREAVKSAISRFEDWVNGFDDEECAAALRGLLERTRVEPPEVT